MPLRCLTLAGLVLALIGGMAAPASATVGTVTVDLRYYSTTSQNLSPALFAGDQEVFVATIKPEAGARPATGVVRFIDGSNVLGTVALHANLSTSYAVLFTRLPAGDHTVTASYWGDPDFAPADSAPNQVRVGPERALDGVGFQGADTEFVLSAHGNGPAAVGQVERTGTQPFVAKVTCLTVHGHDAIATAVVISGALPVGTLIVTEAIDNGPQVNGAAAPDLLRFSGLPFVVRSGANGRCYLPVLFPVGITAGNITVTE